MIDTLLLIAGLALILAGANYLVEGSSAIAKRWGISEFVIGMTIVGIGTSAPEMVVSFISATQGNADIAVGNVIGSNLFNILMILGITAVITPVPLTSNNIKKDIPFGLLAAFLLVVAGCDTWLDGTKANVISRVEGIMFLSFFGVFIAYTIYSSLGKKNLHSERSQTPIDHNINIRRDSVPTELDKPASCGMTNKKAPPLWLSLIMVAGGLGALIYGGDLFVSSASAIAKMLGVSDTVIALTIMAGGTSLPELASCIVAALKKNTDLALGNVIGSNISNIFLILGGSAVIHPLGMNNINNLDLGMLIISALLLFISAFTFKKRKIDRMEGGFFILLYIAFIILTIKG